MHWGQIKSILILSFFILDIYLFAQFLEKKEQADIGVLEQQPSTVEEQLSSESITFRDLPTEQYEETFISVEPHRFKEEDLKKDKPKEAQEPYILNGSMIASKLKDPIKLDDLAPEKVMEVFNETVYYAEEYQYWNWNEDYNVLVFFQNKMDRPIYFNQNGLVIAFLNDKNEIESYVQTMLGEAELLADKRELIEPLTAIEKIYDEGKLYPNDEITNVNIGFYTRVPFESGVQVFAPTWKVDVNGEASFFVNAIEGFIFSTEEEEFIEEMLTTVAKKPNVTKENESILEKNVILTEIIEDVKSRLK